MEILVTEWNRGKHRRNKLSPRSLETNGDELWQFVSGLLSIKKCTLSLEEEFSDLKKASEEHDRLTSDFHSQRIARDQLALDVEMLERDIGELMRKNSHTLACCQQLSSKSEMLILKKAKCLEEIRVINEYANRLEETSKNIRSRCTADEVYTVVPIGNHGNKMPGSRLESVFVKEVKACLDWVTSLILDRKANEELKQETWSRLEYLLSLSSPGGLMKSLVLLTEEAANELTILNRDDQEPRSTEEVAVSGSNGCSSVSETVERQIQEVQLLHVTKSQEVVSSSKKLAVIREGLKRVVESWKESARTSCDDTRAHCEEELLLLQQQVFEANLELSGCESALAELNSLCEDMSHLCEERRKRVESLKEKAMQIEKFREMVESKQDEIQFIVRHNSRAKEKLLRQQTEVCTYVHRNIRPHCEGVSLLLTNLQDQVFREVAMFTSHPNLGQILFPHYMLHVSLGNPQSSLSQCPEVLVAELVDNLRKVHHSSKQVNGISKVFTVMMADSIDQSQARTVLSESEKFIESHQGLFLDRLASVLTKASKGVAFVSEVQSIFQEWWCQPAQGLVCWKTFEEMTLNQWLDQWRVLSTKYLQAE